MTEIVTQTEQVTELVTLIKEVTDIQMVTEVTERKEAESDEERTVVETEVGTNLGVRPTVEAEVLRPGVVIDDPSLVEEILIESGGGGDGGEDGDDSDDKEDDGGAIVMDIVLDDDEMDVQVSKENGADADCDAKVSYSLLISPVMTIFSDDRIEFTLGSVHGEIRTAQEGTEEERGRPRHCRHGRVGSDQDDQDRLRAREGRIVRRGEREEEEDPGDGGEAENQLFSWPTEKQQGGPREPERWSGQAAKESWKCAS